MSASILKFSFIAIGLGLAGCTQTKFGSVGNASLQQAASVPDSSAPGSNSSNPGSSTSNPGSNSSNPGSNSSNPGSSTANPGDGNSSPGNHDPITSGGSTNSENPTHTPPAPPMPPSTPVPPTHVDPACSVADMTQLANLMVQRFSRSTTEVAQNCIDSSNPELYLNLPTGDGSFRDVRYQNTCGNRFCMQRLGFESGRVIEIGPNGDTTLECRHSTPPQTGNACAGIVVQSPLIVTQQTSVTEVAGECIDSAVPTLELNMPGVYPARFVDTCGKRFCQNHGFREGRVVEMADNIAIAECYREPSSLFADATVNVEDVARQCIDDVVRTLADNMPEHNQLRFMSTCGDRYCRQVLGHVSGQVVEYNNGVAQLTCVRTH